MLALQLPFANIMIDHKNKDDLFPSSFIQVLDTLQIIWEQAQFS